VTVPFGPVTGVHGRLLDQVRLTGVGARGFHGVLEHERRDGQDFVVDVVLHLDTHAAAAADALDRTVDYGAIAIAVADAIRGEPVQLIETLAARIATVCLQPAQVHTADVVIHKPQAPITETFADVMVAIRREREHAPLEGGALRRRPIAPVQAVLSLGTNLGEREATLRSAVAGLAATPGIEIDVVSPPVETAPVGGPHQPDYLNAVVLISTELPARELLDVCHRIESAHGRERLVHWGPRTLDIDIIRYGGLISSMPDLVLPHPRARQRAFVLAPWLLADPHATLPVSDGQHAPREVPVADLLEDAADRDEVRERRDLSLDPGEPT
jgi:dihydroneopterin aldolase/2-amino-4-hydroxy-6-hydroxymethyldihydropteridine diphosphokinase